MGGGEEGARKGRGAAARGRAFPVLACWTCWDPAGGDQDGAWVTEGVDLVVIQGSRTTENWEAESEQLEHGTPCEEGGSQAVGPRVVYTYMHSNSYLVTYVGSPGHYSSIALLQQPLGRGFVAREGLGASYRK